ncbi:bile acid:sodium symporter family protein [Pseudofrankia inefficax]|uniref:Bile acid:sodium symporter n=1 Tax=Pseudofrankia inefficax (strain DSM 45817 / CECT 9037 / DDB 130130 / EuI1c) TaxID=298654 RepID=E3JD22_PSEI1|nr:Bile acid:sodium symporter [Pseudofrankia inefficax]
MLRADVPSVAVACPHVSALVGAMIAHRGQSVFCRQKARVGRVTTTGAPRPVTGWRWRAALGRVDRFLLAILGTVALASVLPARGEASHVVGDLADAVVALLFFLYGARLAPRAAWEGLRSWRLHLTVFLATFALFPVIGLAARVLEPTVLPPGLYFGVLFLCLLPSTVQSSIAFTAIGRGNVPAAICAATVSNLAGVVVTPLLAALLLGSRVDVSAGSVLRIAAQLLAPFALGQLARPWIGATLERHRAATGLVDRGSVLIVVYSAFSAGVVAGVWGQVTVGRVLCVIGVDAVILAVVLTATTYGSRRLGFPIEDRIVVTFCGSKKSIATGIPMATVLFAHRDVSLIVLPAMLYHQLQLMVCAALARRYDRRAPEPEPASATALEVEPRVESASRAEPAWPA